MAVGISGAVSAYKAAIERLKDPSSGATAANANPNDFSSMLSKLAHNAVNVEKTAEKQTVAAAAGNADLNSVVMAVAEAELTLNTVVAVRDKVLEAYREIIRMPI